MSKFGVAPSYPFAPMGSVYFTRSPSLMSKVIRWAERDRDEPPSWASHTGIVTAGGYMVPAVTGEVPLAAVSESLWRNKHHIWWEKYQSSQGYAVAVFSPIYTDMGAASRAVDNALSRTGQRYGWWRLLGFLGERITRIPFSRLFILKSRVVCSNHVALALEAGGIELPDKPGALDPDDLMDHFIAHPERFHFIGWAIVPGKPPK